MTQKRSRNLLNIISPPVRVRLQHDVSRGYVYDEHGHAGGGALLRQRPREASLDVDLRLVPSTKVLLHRQVEAVLRRMVLQIMDKLRFENFCFIQQTYG